MAEQVSHNVVNGPESASNTLADVIANTTTTNSAGDGTNNTTDNTTTANELATAANHDLASADQAEHPTGAAEPSAGEAGLKAPAEDQTNGVQNISREGSIADGSADHSITSDNEGSRGEAAKDGSHHVRTNSVKKPVTFSKVSVTKNFMAKSASPVPAAPKLGDKPSPLSAPAQPAAAKPRLIAKTASSLQSIQRPRPGVEAGGPDASKVWNKNQPVAPPPPKQFTDEELKQRYGIHLATRLQADENGKESKWADIDDDEEDWAPETVTWMDGTKSSLTPAETAPLQKDAQQQQAPAQTQAPTAAEGAKPSLVMKRPSEMGPPRTILKPGAAAQQAKQPNGSAATTPSAEKPSLKAKSPAPTPAKSPWAALPPVETVSPINPPVQQPPPPATGLPTQDARAYESQPPQQPAREIAADTFDRSWREGEGAPRELFNSSSGRYEPAPEGRRGSMKPDPYRKPSLLQRPSQGAAAFAEPSPAFQSRTSSQMDGAPYGRRRGSSVSQGSLPPGRRMSRSSHDLPPAIEDERRQSAVSGRDMRSSPVASRPQFAQQSAWEQQMPPMPEPGNEAEDPVKVQERVMREKREEAKRRRQEEEERMEKEKQERLKAKLAALEGAGKSKKERDAEAAAASTAQAQASTPASEKADAITAPKATDRPAVPSKPAEASAAAAPALEDQSMPPAPAKLSPSDEKLPSPLPPKPQQPIGPPSRQPASADHAQRDAAKAHLSPGASARAPFGQQQQSSQYRAPASSYSSPGDRPQQGFGRSPLANSDTLSGWGTAAPGGNVWGTPGLGNGTFEKASSFAPVPMSQQNLPPLNGLAQSSQPDRISPQAFGQGATRSPSLQQPQMAQQQRAFPPPGLDSRPEAAWNSTRGSAVSPAPGFGRPAHLPSPIAPPSRAQAQQQPIQRPDAISAWNNAASRLPHQYAADADAASRKQQEGVIAPTPNDTIKETFKQTSADQGRLGGPRRFDKTEYTVHDAQGSRSVSTLSPAPPSTQTQPIGPPPAASPFQDPWKVAAENPVRIPDGSLNPAHGGAPVQQPPIARPSTQPPHVSRPPSSVNFPTGPLPGVPTAPSKDQSPPPPETMSHPVYSGDVGHPNVKLPPPPPVVKLPPSTMQAPPGGQQQTVLMPHRPMQAWGPPGVSRPIAMNPDWQARFNGLFNRASIHTEVPPSPPKTPPKTQDLSLAVTSSSRTAMDDLPAGVLATVSLPQSPPKRTVEGFVVDDSDDVVSKPAIDQMFSEELGFGSRPIVRTPKNIAYDYDVLHARPAQKVNASPPTAESKDFFDSTWWPKNREGYFVKIPGTKNGDRNKLVRHRRTFSDRKPSGRFNTNNKGSNKDSASNSPSTTAAGTPAAGSRKTSFQKAPTPTAASSPAAESGPAANNGGREKKKWTMRGGPKRAASGAPTPVKST